MSYGRLIEYEGQQGEAFRRAVVHPAGARRAQQESAVRAARFLSRWVFDRTSGRPALRLAWRSAAAAPAAPGVRAV